MRHLITTLFCLLALAMTPTASAKVVGGYTNVAGKSTGLIVFNITSVDYRPDLTRLTGELVGRPHTSNRIDELILITPSGKQYKSTDIEGVDMKRYFQWEDNGRIEVEIDFPPMKQQKSFTIKATGPNGESQSVIIRKNKSK